LEQHGEQPAHANRVDDPKKRLPDNRLRQTVRDPPSYRSFRKLNQKAHNKAIKASGSRVRPGLPLI
jgi:hypothetical protein